MTFSIALIGFGEAGSTFAGAGGWGSRAFAYDSALAPRAKMAELGVTSCTGAAEAIRDAMLVLSLVTADQALPVAQECAGLIAPEAIFCDMNSVAPETKRAAAKAFAEAGKRYVDVAVMAPVNPARLAVPLLLAGPDAPLASERLGKAGFSNMKTVGEAVGRASAIKLVRSVMVKGLEALTAEMLMAAQAEDVADEVLASLDASEKAVSWAERADYNLDRMLVHGQRRAAEMAEAARMLRTLGIAPKMTDNTVSWQRALGALAVASPPQGFKAKMAAITASGTIKEEG